MDITFLNKPITLKCRSGMEFLDWQPTTFFEDLKEAVKETYSGKTNELILNKNDRALIESVIKKHTNISVTIVAESTGNLAIDAGYITPNSVLNNNGVDVWLGHKYTKLHEAFKELNKKVIKGYCDLKTGKVEGDYKDIQFNLYINKHLPSIMNEQYIKESKFPIFDCIAAGILHECGHAFFGLNYISSSVIDNAMLLQTVKMLINEPDKNRRAIIVKDVKSTIDVKLSDDVSKEDMSEDEITVIFKKGLINRDYRRTLSLGVTEMTSEVLADAYAIRMGASHALNALLASFNKNKVNPFYMLVKIIGLIVVTKIAPAFAGISTPIIVIMSIITLYSQIGEYVPGIYDTPYRRMKAILRENIAYLEENKNKLQPVAVTKMIVELKKMEQLVEKEKGFFESTGLQRVLGYITNGSDFRKTDFEHYTAELANSTLALHTNFASN